MILSYVTVLRLHADAVRRELVDRSVDTGRVRDALRLARVLVGVVRSVRERSPSPTPLGAEADEIAAVLVAFAVMWPLFGSGYDAVVVVDAIVRAQALRGGWRLDLSARAMSRLVVDVMFRADTGRSIDYAGLAETLASALRDKNAPRTNPRARIGSPRRLAR